ncbi:MAG: hypothetical protein JOZ54_04970 [Acidobacteria bacterium]|nr:hypothetical protein [Acidobacteriota bacterium]
MKARIRYILEVLGGAAALAVLGAAITHGVYSAQMTWMGCAVGAAFALLVTAGLLQPWRRTRVFGARLGQCALAVLLSAPLTLVAGRGAVRLDLWRVKRYVATELAPQLERDRTARGVYPAKLERRALHQLSYQSDGRTFELSVMDPGVCGRVATYSSATRQWSETNSPCWY